MQGAEQRVYKTVDSTPLSLYLFYPELPKPTNSLPVIVFFFGGAWVNGSVKQFEQQCRYFSGKGMIAVAGDYRVRSRHNTTPFESVMDAKSAMRYLRRHAKDLMIDGNKIVASGGSAGGHLAAATALIKDVNEQGEDTSISAVPNALVLYNPALDLSRLQSPKSVSIRAEWRSKAHLISPQQHITTNTPRTLIFHGTADTTISFTQAVNFCKAMKAKGNKCELVEYAGRHHGFFNYGRPDYEDCLRKTEAFLKSSGIIQ